MMNQIHGHAPLDLSDARHPAVPAVLTVIAQEVGSATRASWHRSLLRRIVARWPVKRPPSGSYGGVWVLLRVNSSGSVEYRATERGGLGGIQVRVRQYAEFQVRSMVIPTSAITALLGVEPDEAFVLPRLDQASPRLGTEMCRADQRDRTRSESLNRLKPLREKIADLGKELTYDSNRAPWPRVVRFFGTDDGIEGGGATVDDSRRDRCAVSARATSVVGLGYRRRDLVVLVVPDHRRRNDRGCDA